MTDWHFCECQAVGCGLRYPAPGPPGGDARCPRCGGQVTEEPALPRPEMQAPDPLPEPTPRLAVLADNLRSAYNVGALFRCADGVAAHHLYLCGISPTPAHPGVGKTALGAEQAVPWSYHAHAPRLARTLQTGGSQIWVLERSPGAVNLFCTRIPIQDEIVLVIGNERAGVDPALVALADRQVYLPMAGIKESLNVAGAAAVALYCLRWMCPS